jgi:hypothetical protein
VGQGGGAEVILYNVNRKCRDKKCTTHAVVDFCVSGECTRPTAASRRRQSTHVRARAYGARRIRFIHSPRTQRRECGRGTQNAPRSSGCCAPSASACDDPRVRSDVRDSVRVGVGCALCETGDPSDDGRKTGPIPVK